MIGDDNQDGVKTGSRLCAAALACLALATAECASKAERRPAAESPGPATALAAAPAKTIPHDPRLAFLEGYKSLRDKDFAFAAACFGFGASRDPQFADYDLYYLGLTQQRLGEKVEAERAMRHLEAAYPQSVFAERAELVAAEIELESGRAPEASAIASRVVVRTSDRRLEQDARLLLARALIASGDPRGAYEQLEAVRNRDPRGPDDAEARSMERSLLSAHPEIADTNSFEYHRAEAELLLREGQAVEALSQVDAAMRRSLPEGALAELLWIEARAAHSNPPRARRALTEYLAVAPRGPMAPEVLDKLARIYWNENDTVHARVFFRRVIHEFPASRLAPEAMFSIGRTYEDDGALESARAEYERLAKAYPRSEPAREARFRAAFTLYMSGRYQSAARRFGAGLERASESAERDMFQYWRARALEKSGDIASARAIFARLAQSTDSNYYPALAGQRVRTQPATLPAAFVSDSAPEAPRLAEPAANFHLEHLLALEALGIKELQAPEIRALQARAANVPELRGFVLARYEEAGAWCDAIRAAETMAKRREISSDVAERFRYPRGYIELVRSAAARERIGPDLLLALMRQESLFDPNARSWADARGLMQLLPATADRVGANGLVHPIDLYQPATNVEIGSSYLRQLLDMFRGDQIKAVAAYNGGEHAVQKWSAKFPGDDDQWVENIGYRETRDYVKKVIGGVREYRLLYGPH